MKRTLVLAAVLAMTALMVPVASAAGPVLSIVGHSTSADIGSPAGGERIATISVREAADGSIKGHVSIRVVIAATGAIFSTTRGDVVCIEPTSGAPGGEGYEIRYLITKAGGGAALPTGSYRSLFVRDDAAGDQTDEVPNFGFLGDPTCGITDLVSIIDWDDVVKGSVTVKN